MLQQAYHKLVITLLSMHDIYITLLQAYRSVQMVWQIRPCWMGWTLICRWDKDPIKNCESGQLLKQWPGSVTATQINGYSKYGFAKNRKVKLFLLLNDINSLKCVVFK